MDVSAQGDEREDSPLSEPGEGPSSPPADGNRRKSGRAKRKPELFSSAAYSSSRPSQGGNTKRKRNAQQEEGEEDDNDASDGGAEGVDEGQQDGEEGEEESDEEADEEELKERRKAERKRAARSKKKEAKEPKKSSTKRTAKKPKITNGVTSELTLRPAVNGNRPAAKPKKPRVRPSDFADEYGLYAEVFGRGHTTDAVAAEWLTKYEQHNINGMTELVNFILRCTGTDLKVEDQDIEDVDNVANKLNDLQEEYQAQSITDYPLISRAKKFKSFQYVLTSFFNSLIRTIHSSSVLYNDSALVENIQVWVTSMSSAPIRPFRHTATIISLAIVTTLCSIAREVSLTISNTRKQLETEKRKKSVNKGRAEAMQSKVQEGEKKLEVIDSCLHDSFDTVFVHRYRDVDPKIRAECINALGVWINTYREMFFDGQYLRYLGWVLSDTVANTRAVVVSQLHRLYQNKDNIAGLRAFTERFRPRIVEMAVRDAEPSVRSAVVELLDLVREAGLLEPDDIDSVGRLVFDSESRVRKAAGKFFVENIQDVYDALTESLEEEMNESFVDDDDEDNFEIPRRSWIKYKCLVDVLQVYDGQESEGQDEQDVSLSRTTFNGRVDSRFVLATEAIYSHFEELHQWEHLAGYLLYDHSQIPESSGEEDSANTVKQLYKLSEGQEGILLEVLSSAVKLHIIDISKSDTDKKGRKTKLLVERMEERQESIAHSLSQIIPRLLNKFGSVPEAASAILRLEHLVDLNLIQDLQKDAAAYSDLIGNINKQFLTHSHQAVLAEATVAFLHARTSDELKEAIETKVQELWDDTLEALRTLSATKGKEVMPPLSVNVLTALSNTVMRISNLTSVSDCTSILEAEPRTSSKKQKETSEPAVDIMLNLSKRGLREEDSDEDVARLEFELVTNSFKTILVYFMWKVQYITAALSSGELSFDTDYFDSLSTRRDAFVAILTSIMQARSGLDELRVSATLTLLDVQTVFGTLRNAGAGAKNFIPSLDDEVASQIQSLVQEIVPETRALISRIHDLAERAFAKKSRRKIEASEVAEDDQPMDSQSDVDSSLSEDEDDEVDEETREALAAQRARNVLLAEQKLCQITGKIVLAIVGRVLDAAGRQSGSLKKKLLRNKTRLGQNYKEVVTYLDSAKGGAKKAAPQKGKAKQAEEGGANGTGPGPSGGASKKSNGKMKSAERVEDDDEDEEEEVRAEEDEEEDLQARELMDEDERPGTGAVEDDVELTPPPDDIEDDVMGD
ncbi:hypothetical protein AJ79_04126 [Helicocarpus griseus UAMH5409]|uniref:SCD domain-containing protein n=1 Tax=Helicocarpus griseus UAMH5409 TaxID=1447875 RepID=A0A2B7XVP3_9EURO|nr:hypothetical protein AJ79_04126 [Helicocarpus griseus UAMH5409]